MTQYIVYNDAGVVSRILDIYFDPVVESGEYYSIVEDIEETKLLLSNKYWFNSNTNTLEPPTSVAITVDNSITTPNSPIVLSGVPQAGWIKIGNEYREVTSTPFSIVGIPTGKHSVEAVGKYISPPIYIEVQELSTLKESLWETTKTFRDNTLMMYGCSTPMGLVDISTNSVQIMSAYAVQAMSDPEFTLSVTMKDNTVVECNQEQFLSIYTSMIAYLKNKNIRSEQLRSQIFSSESIEDLRVVSIYTGWPT